MYAMRQFAVSHARSYSVIYQTLERALLWLNPLFLKLGYKNIEKPVSFTEKAIKNFLFDCQMCGQCVLHDTGMSCPMNCPKQLFISMAISAGMTSAIVNPMHSEVVQAVRAADVVMGNDPDCASWLSYYREPPAEGGRGRHSRRRRG